MKSLFLGLFAALIVASGINSAWAASGAEVCEQISKLSPKKAIHCTNIISKHQFQNDVLDACKKIAERDSGDALACVDLVKDKYFDKEAAATIVALADFTNGGTLSGINASADKDYLNNSAALCKDLAKNQLKNRAIECLSNSGTPHEKEEDGERNCPSHSRIKQKLTKVLEFLNNGNDEYAIRTIERLNRSLEKCDY